MSLSEIFKDKSKTNGTNRWKISSIIKICDFKGRVKDTLSPHKCTFEDKKSKLKQRLSKVKVEIRSKEVTETGRELSR